MPTSRRDDIVSALERYFRHTASSVASAYLFGSHAENRAHRESDIDVAVLFAWNAVPTRRQRFDARVQLSADLVHVLRHDSIDVVALNDAPPELARRIITKGRRIFCGDAELDHAFVRDAQLRAADIMPFPHRTRRVKLAALSR